MSQHQPERIDDGELRGTGADAAEEAGPTRAYWRSVERLLDSPAVDPSLRERLSAAATETSAAAAPTPRTPEFPDGADTPPDALSRRTMLGLMGASFGLAGLTGCRRPVEHIVPYVEAPEEIRPGIPRAYATTMPLGTSAFGVVVESHEGRPTKIEGNELHPSSLGSASSWMQAATLDLYDPDRGRSVLQRAGSDGDEPTKATWADVQSLFDEAAAKSPTGRGLAVLSEAFASPTMARLAGRFRERFPEARFVVWDPAGDANVFAGIEQATGQAQRPVYHLEQADVIVTLDADPLLTEGEALANTRGFAAGRKITGDGRRNRLYAVESSLSVTGANADHRLRVPSSAMLGVAGTLAASAVPGVEVFGDLRLPAGVEEKLAVIADDLRRAGSRGVVIAGRRQPPEVHALVHRINQSLGSVGGPVTLRPLDDVGWGRVQDLGALTGAMVAGEVSTLLVLGGNPAYDAPGALGFADALGSVETVARLALRPDETSALAGWYLPQSHFLESWGDARAADGTASVIQPLIAPLFDSKSAAEVLAMLAGAGQGDAPSGYALVRETWGTASEEAVAPGSAWQRILHDGVAPAGSGPAPMTLPLPATTALLDDNPAGGEGFEVSFLISPSVHDGRFANNAWLQEEPDPITRITWSNAAMLSPATAETLGVEPGDVVRITLGERSIEVPAWIAPGQADGTVGLELGYGRRAAGRVGNGRGADAYALRGAGEGWWERGAQVEKTGERHELAQTQEHWAMEGRAPVRETTLEALRDDPEQFSEVEGPPLKSLWQEPNVRSGYQWGMAIDLSSCIGCNACVTACQAENNIPVVGPEQVSRGREMLWLRVDRYYTGALAEPAVVFQPIPCMHCENAPCEQVCPVAATVHDDEGLNAMVYNRCIGTRYCSNNCPYKVRRFNFFNYTKDTPELVQMAMNPDVTVRSRGVMEKCTYCVQRIDEGKRAAKLEDRQVRDGEIRPACQQTCPADAIVFGNVNDPESAVSRAKAEPQNYAVLAELNNRPRTTYLAKVRNRNPAWGEEA